MLQKFALALKTKTIEFFADDDDDDAISTVDLDPPPHELLTGQRVVVLKPDPLPRPQTLTLVPSLFSAVASFRAAYLRLQASHAPFDPAAAASADVAAVAHLRRLSDFKRSFFRSSGDASSIPSLSSLLESQVRENQSLLRSFETAVDRLQADIDCKDSEAAVLRSRLRDLDSAVMKLERRLERASSPPDEKVEALLTLSVFDSVLRDSCRGMHRFAKNLMDFMKKSGFDFVSAANSIHPDVNYAKSGHRRYALLSYISLIMLEGFDSQNYSLDEAGIGCNSGDLRFRRKNSLRHFVEHSAVDAFELMEANPGCDFARFCERKHDKLFCSIMESCPSSALVNWGSPGSLHLMNPLYDPFVSMASSVWMLHKLAWAYDPVVEIFQVGRGTEFSNVYMESVVRRIASKRLECGKGQQRPKVAFTVVPGFTVGRTVIQCRVYLDGS
ncbi:protein GRAVITROPIC IN THE LIGHT 1 [Dioscorea cayenensis subsp. rotundata]|uniref:Protein GRAVITROPIC IN THE LIGHT 1 n=1 Tax=Dioscorea cayennensis subsp. rotundata TaxID=55577 RepID=A0AB40AZE9_DIOCR|nr:protein GRAVITROPIC IN THE LIGHT 1 [Dioscorea cayenensis subsp. rotundata]